MPNTIFVRSEKRGDLNLVIGYANEEMSASILDEFINQIMSQVRVFDPSERVNVVLYPGSVYKPVQLDINLLASSIRRSTEGLCNTLNWVILVSGDVPNAKFITFLVMALANVFTIRYKEAVTFVEAIEFLEANP